MQVINIKKEEEAELRHKIYLAYQDLNIEVNFEFIPVSYLDYLHDYACKKLIALTKWEMDKNTDREVLLRKYPYGMSLRLAKRTGGKPIKN